MTVYFVTELDNSLSGRFYIKIGRSKVLRRRLSDLQTGNRRTIALMGEIRTSSVEEDCEIERELHDFFRSKHDAREWFFLTPEDVIDSLKRYSSRAYIAIGQIWFAKKSDQPSNSKAEGSGEFVKFFFTHAEGYL